MRLASIRSLRRPLFQSQPSRIAARYFSNASSNPNEPPEESKSTSQLLGELDIVPFGQGNNFTELEQRDQNIKRQLEIAKAGVRLKVRKPISPGMRWWRTPIYPYLHKGGPVWELTIPKKKHGGRNNTGKITVRHHGGGFKRRLRVVDFFRLTRGVHVVKRIEHDPNRSSHLALIEHKETGALSYILATVGMREGDEVESFRSGVRKEIIDKLDGETDPNIVATYTTKVGNCLPLSMIPLGTVIHSVGLRKGGPGVLCRAAGTFARLYDKRPETDQAVVRLQSGEHRLVQLQACATIGVVSNPDHHHRMLGKAGRSRNLGIRPTVRGLAQNKHDHPMGGGRGKKKSKKIPVSPWGIPSKSGYRTRRGKNVNKLKLIDRPRFKRRVRNS